MGWPNWTMRGGLPGTKLLSWGPNNDACSQRFLKSNIIVTTSASCFLRQPLVLYLVDTGTRYDARYQHLQLMLAVSQVTRLQITGRTLDHQLPLPTPSSEILALPSTSDHGPILASEMTTGWSWPRWLSVTITVLYYALFPIYLVLRVLWYILVLLSTPFVSLGHFLARISLIPWRIFARFEVSSLHKPKLLA